MAADQPPRSVEVRPEVTHTRGPDQRPGPMRAVGGGEMECLEVLPDLRHLRVLEDHAEPLALGAAEGTQANPGHARGKAQVVVVDRAVAPPAVAAVHHQRPAAEAAHVDGGGEAGGAGADDHALPQGHPPLSACYNP